MAAEADSGAAPPPGSDAVGLDLGLPDRVLLVTGPTAAGKTEIAIALAEELDAEIVSADSRQVYRYMDVGTAKPDAQQLSRVKHHLVDVVDPDQAYNLAAWRRAAIAALADIASRGRRAIVCGGTGLYLSRLLGGLDAAPAADDGLRNRLQAEEEASPGALHERLLVEDPVAAERIHAHDTLRLVRALERLAAAGDQQQPGGGPALPSRSLVLVLDRPREQLYALIDSRARAMVAGGLLDEIVALRERGYTPDCRAFDSLGYRQAWACLEGRLEAGELEEKLARATRQYAKRQLTWLRNQLAGQWIDAERGDEFSDRARCFFETG